MENIFKPAAIILMLFAAFATKVPAQDSTKAMKIRSAVSLQQFTFEAQTAIPQARASIQLTSEYTVQIKEDSLISDLPYFGRAYFSAPNNPIESDLHFTSTAFSYDITIKKQGGWLVVIKPQDSNGITEMDFTIFDNGTAYLTVASANRDAITFNGMVKY